MGDAALFPHAAHHRASGRALPAIFTPWAVPIGAVPLLATLVG